MLVVWVLLRYSPLLLLPKDAFACLVSRSSSWKDWSISLQLGCPHVPSALWGRRLPAAAIRRAGCFLINWKMNKKTPHWLTTQSKLFFPCFSLIPRRVYIAVGELPNIRFSLAHNEAVNSNTLLKPIYCISGPSGSTSSLRFPLCSPALLAHLLKPHAVT